MTGPACVFCGIATGRVPCQVVAETPETLSIMNLHPFNPGHVLVMPRRHAENVWELDGAAYARLMSATQEIARALNAAYRPLKVGMLISGFDVAHVHVHVVPLHEPHDLTSKRFLDGLVSRAEPEDLMAGAARIRAAIDPAGPQQVGPGRPAAQSASSLEYRVATPDDCATLAQWNHQLIRDEGHRNPMTVADLERRMRDWLTSGAYTALVFEEAGEPVAYALYRDSGPEIYLRQFFVAQHRRRQGIGRRAMDILLASVWPRDRRLTVEVLADNESAVSFWRAIGYRDYALTLEIMPRT